MGGAEARARASATGSNWWTELESGSGVGMAAILSTSRIISSNRELDITSLRLWLLFVFVVGGWVGLRLGLGKSGACPGVCRYVGR